MQRDPVFRADSVRAPRARASSWPRLRVPAVRMGTNALLLLVVLYIAATQNRTFWNHALQALPAARGPQDYSLLACLFVTLCVLLVLVLAPFSTRRLLKPALSLLLVVAAACSYFMDTYGVVIDKSMIANLMLTDPRESSEILGPALLLHVLATGLVPALLVWRVELVRGSRVRELLRRVLLVLAAVGLMLGSVLADYKNVSLWARNHREIRTYVNPTYPLFSLYRHAKGGHRKKGPVAVIAADATRVAARSGKPRVVILVVGETVRAANFQLTGYARHTTPELAAIDGVVAFNQVHSCGTSTAVSVPCMFSRRGRGQYRHSQALAEENLLDVLQRAGIEVRWRDNNSNSSDVTARVPSEDVRHVHVEGLCSAESCYDEVLLRGLDAQLAVASHDQLIVLHMLGSHGPSYYRRYPPAFRRFVPDCARDDVQHCSRESIVNAYDNTILYGDHVLARVIRMLEERGDRVEPTLLYLSDHGESLGEDGLYLHGLPYAMAPDVQKHVPLVVWSPSLDQACLAALRDRPYSHDNLFDTVLGLFAVSTTQYRPQADILHDCAPQSIRRGQQSDSTAVL
jgi:lipid A ethanolaminephosphotransferase